MFSGQQPQNELNEAALQAAVQNYARNLRDSTARWRNPMTEQQLNAFVRDYEQRMRANPAGYGVGMGSTPIPYFPNFIQEIPPSVAPPAAPQPFSPDANAWMNSAQAAMAAPVQYQPAAAQRALPAQGHVPNPPEQKVSAEESTWLKEFNKRTRAFHARYGYGDEAIEAFYSDQPRQNISRQESSPEQFLNALNSAADTFSRVRAALPTAPSPAIYQPSSGSTAAHQTEAERNAAWHSAVTTFSPRFEETKERIEAATPAQMSQIHAIQQARDEGLITPQQSSSAVSETLGIRPYIPGVTPYTPSAPNVPPKKNIEEIISQFNIVPERQNVNAQPNWRSLSPAERRHLQYQLQLNNIPYANQDFMPQQFAEQMNMPNVPPVILNEIMQQMQNQPTRNIPSGPRRNISQRIMSSFDPNMFSPEFIPEE